MPKKTTDEIVNDAPDTTGAEIAPLGTAFDYLMQGIIETEVVQESNRFQLPQLYVYMPGKKFTAEGANRGYVITYPDGRVPEVNIERLRLARMDAPLMQRIMWEYDVKTGKRIQQDEPMPACASSNGVSPRKSDYFGYIGREFVDWRDGQKVTILADGCKTCPLGQWKETFNADSGWTDPIIDTNAKGQPYTRRSAPPCQELPAYAFFDLDRKIPLLYTAANFTHMQWIMGSNGRTNRRFDTVIKGVEEYYNTANGTKRPDVSPDNGVMFPLIFTTRMVSNAPYGMTPAPQIALADTALTPDELNTYATAIQLYRADEGRKMISGEFWGLGESMSKYSDEAAGGVSQQTENNPW